MKPLNQKTTLVTLAFAAIVALSCKKNADIIPSVNPLAPPVNSLIKNQKSGTAENVFEYDNTGRVKKIITNGVPEYLYNYKADSLIQTRYFSNGNIMETYYIKLNSSGLVETYINDLYPSTTIKYEFNEDKTMARKLNYNYGVLANITYYFYSNGNLVKDSTANQGPGTGWYGRSYDYYSDKYSTLENINRGQAYWGAGNKNPLKKITYSDKGVVTGTQEFQIPEVDPLNRISKTAMTTNNAGTASVYNYTYY